MLNSLSLKTIQSQRILKILWIVSSFFFWLCIALWTAILGLGLALHFFFIPHIDSFRPKIESTFSSFLGTQIRIGEIRSISNSLYPMLEVSDVSIVSESGQRLLLIKRAVGSLSTTSILRFTLDTLTIDGCQLTIKKFLNGTIEVAGVPLVDDQSSNLLDRFFSIREIAFQSSQVSWIDESHGNSIFEVGDIDLFIKNGIRNHQFSLDASPPIEFSNRLSWRAQFNQPLITLHPGQWKQWSGETYLQTHRLHLADVSRLFSLEKNITVTEGNGWLRIWSDVSNGNFSKHLFDFDFQDIKFPVLPINAPLNVSTLKGRIRFAPWSTGHELSIDQLSVGLFGLSEPFVFSKARFALSDLVDPFGSESQGEIELHQINIGHLSKIFKTALPHHIVNDSIASINTNGTLNEIKATWGKLNSQKGGGFLNSQIPNWLERSKKLLSPFTQKLNGSSPGTTHNSGSSYFQNNFFSKVKNFNISGQVTDLERPVSYFLNSPDSNISPSSTPGPSKPTPIQLSSALPSTNTVDTIKQIPHFKGLSASFSLTESSGKLNLGIKDGYLEFLGALEHPLVEMKNFSSQIDWVLSDGEFDLSLTDGFIENGNGSATFNFTWFNPSFFQLSHSNLGSIDLYAQINSLEANSLFKYLPVSINSSVRGYLKDAITHGSVDKGKIRIKGPLSSLPFKNTSEGEFNISARLNHLGFNYFPKTFFKSPNFTLTEWPSISELQGELLIKNRSLSVFGSSALIGFDTNNTSWNKIDAKINDLIDPTLVISGESKSLMSNYLSVFNHTSLSTRLGQPFEQTKSRGLAELKLKLNLPLLQIDRSKVQGTIGFLNTDLLFSSDSPSLTKTRGSLTFTESSVFFQNIQAHVLGGESKIEGSFKSLSNNPDNALVIKSTGSVTSEGLEKSCEIGLASKFGTLSKGQTNYSAIVNIKKSGIPEILISSNLQGLALMGPTPLKKSAESILPLAFDNSIIKELNNNHYLERFNLTLGDQLSLRLFKDSTPTRSFVTSGNMFIAPNVSTFIHPVTPPNFSNLIPPNNSGWTINAIWPEVQLDDWQTTLNSLFFDSTKSVSCVNFLPDLSVPNTLPPKSILVYNKFSLPSSIKLQTNRLTTQGRDFHMLTALATRDGDNWKATVQSQEVSGKVKVLLDVEPSSRRISAQLSQLVINPIKNKMDDPLMSNDEPFFPWLDVSIDNLQIKDHPLGHVEFEAHNEVSSKGERFWQLSNVQLANPDVSLKASAKWSPSIQANAKGTQSHVDITLNVLNAGHLLSRLGTPGVVRDGAGALKGQLSWKGSLINPDFESLSGSFNLDIEKGQFLKTDPGASRLLGVLNLQALPRRLTLDFRDLFGDGFAFDHFKGDVEVKDGTAVTKNLVMKGIAGTVFLEGSANIGAETQDLRVVVVPEINAGTASLLYSTINPVVGLTSFLAQYVIRQPLIQANTRTFHINGSWSDPNVTKIETPLEGIK